MDKWQARLPWRLSEADQQAGYHYRLSLWQVEFSRTQVFADPVRGRQWFEAVIRDNLDGERPDHIQLIFERRVTKQTPGYFRTQVVQEGVNPSLHAYYKSLVARSIGVCWTSNISASIVCSRPQVWNGLCNLPSPLTVNGHQPCPWGNPASWQC
ncbi:MAG: hypothetical protein KJ077_23840 [Anaerolineae bacterium]|nr:hypothetical protein [Anaerolineae bacterium]